MNDTTRSGGPRIAVVGGGITGLAAALRLRDRLPADTEITVYEQSGALGGKLRTGSLGGATVEFGAEAFLTRDPAGGDSAAVALARRVGLADALVHPAIGRAALAIGGELRPMPPGTLVGVPGDLAAVAPVARPAAERDTDGGRPLLGPDEDPTVGGLVRRRLGDEVVDRLVDPMLGGVYAGRADELSLAATMPGLARAARVEPTLTRAVRAAMAAAPRPAGSPVFATVDGGVSRLVAAVAEAARAEIRLNAAVRELLPVPGGWRLVIGPTRDPELVEVDAVVLALPARPAARLLGGVDVAVGALVGRLDYASVALISLALPGPPDSAAASDRGVLSATGGAVPTDLSGFLVPATEQTLVKAATFFTSKWAHLRRPDGTLLLRASVGRHGEEHLLQRADDELVSAVHRELSELLGTELPAPVDSHVQRWGGALPQYAPGHLDRVAAARAALRTAHPTLALAGAGYDGVGIPVCVRSGETAAEEIIKVLGVSGT
ncbi:protoporphyrinogen oxidase [Plantactinospora sp. KLBMP9567]|uniref:protoporphyrinogen oxidase n=1 Tax=Plantactinospora sp. KLBMP9567 TaxID=3085900 RepID=UPI0029815302|nr:protoporphyrinogen oxidase [Plantactinospora sp. KLBMP9567]MDW5323759.1 protoporphyrinogen oxidase [Plantactinospora sp. KLBMP9567]MDW5326879.1 protoporphyrinogen oxidase [Plantactinospora sp. KLBMP9567]